VIGVHRPSSSSSRAWTTFAGGEGHADRLSVAVDSDMQYGGLQQPSIWPALYFIDAKGRIRHHQFGEGEYAHAE